MNEDLEKINVNLSKHSFEIIIELLTSRVFNLSNEILNLQKLNNDKIEIKDNIIKLQKEQLEITRSELEDLNHNYNLLQSKIN